MIQQCKLNHGIMPFWADITESKAKKIGFEVMDTRFVNNVLDEVEA